MAWTSATERILQFDSEVFGSGIGTERVCQSRDHEFYIVLSITARDVAGTSAILDVSGAASGTLVLIDPTGDRKRYSLSNRTDGTDGLLQYQIAADQIIENGPWQLYGEIAFTTSIITTQRSILHVEGNQYRAPEKKKGGTYSLISHDTSAAAGTYILYLQNDTSDLFGAQELIVGSAEASMWKLWQVTGTAAGGSSLTAAALDLSDPETVSLTARGNDSITGLSTGNQLGTLRCEADSYARLSLDGLWLGHGDAIAVEYDTGTTGIAEARIVGTVH